MNMKQRILAGFMVSGLVACASSGLESRHLNRSQVGSTLVCVLVPADASYFGKLYSDSGNEIATRIRKALTKIDHPSLQVSQLNSNATTICGQRGAKLVIQTEVLHYEEHSKALFGKPDRIELKLSLFSLEAAENRQSVIFETKSNLPFSSMLGSGFDRAVWKLMGVAQQENADSFGLD
jgi:hypothetical protein